MTHRFYDLVSASIEIDTTALQEKLDELDGGIDESRVLDIVRDNSFVTEDDVRQYLDDNDYVAFGDGRVLDPQYIDTLEGNDDVPFRALEARIASLEAALQTAAALTGDRLDRLEATSNTAYNFFSLLGKMISLLLNGSRS